MEIEQELWQAIETARYDTIVTVKVGCMTFEAFLRPDASENEHGACDQWQAAHEGEHPPCWSGGACWASNEDEAQSLQPTHWRHIAPSRTEAEVVAEIVVSLDDLGAALSAEQLFAIELAKSKIQSGAYRKQESEHGPE